MPKLKTHRGAKKRFSRTASGRFTHRRGYRNHILTKKSTQRKRHLRHNGLVDPSDTAAVARLLPYS